MVSVSPAAVNDDSKRGHYRGKIMGYMDRAEHIKAHVNQMKEGNNKVANEAHLCNAKCGAQSLRHHTLNSTECATNLHIFVFKC